MHAHRRLRVMLHACTQARMHACTRARADGTRHHCTTLHTTDGTLLHTPPCTCVPQVKEAALELGYQPDETFCLKVSQLRELFGVRWSVFLLGPAGCGKSAIWRTLVKAQNSAGEKTVRDRGWLAPACAASVAAAHGGLPGRSHHACQIGRAHV